MTALAPFNGHAPRVAEIIDPELGPEIAAAAIPGLAGLGERTTRLVDEVAAALRAAIALEQTEREELEVAVAESKARERQLKRTLATLETTVAPAPPKPKPKKHKGERSPEWTPSPEKLELATRATLTYGLEHPKGFSIGAVAGVTPGLSPEAMAKIMQMLRQDELVRPSGKVRGGGVKWKLTPEAREQARTLADGS